MNEKQLAGIIERIERLAVEEQSTSLSNPGVCVACGESQDGCEPDARRYECESCGAKAVYGAEELLFHVA